MGKVPFTLEEKLKYYIIPSKLYANYKLIKEYFYGEPEIHLLKYLVDRNKNSIDIGANKGVYTKALSKFSKKVFSFEPNPKMYEFLKKNAPKNTEIFPYALSNENKIDTLRIPKGRKGLSNQGASLNKKKVDKSYVGIDVECKRLDDLDLTNIGFIKIDVEGFEKEVLEGAKNLILKERPYLLVEIEECHNKVPIRESISWVENLGYRGFAFFDNVLKSVDFFDEQRHHTAARGTKNYINNFIFITRNPIK